MVAERDEGPIWIAPIQIDKMTDEMLAERAQRRPEQFDALYMRYVDPVYRYCGRRLTPAAAEDATSATFLKAMQAIDRFDPALGSFRSWLFAIAHNTIVDQLRRRTHDDIAAFEIESGGPSVEDQAIAADQRRRLSDALRQLPDDQRDVIHLRLANLTSPEIAHVLGKRPGTVRTLQHRAVRQLQTLLGAGDHKIDMNESDQR